MIKINLLPVRASKKRELGKQWLVLFAMVLAGAAVGNFFWYDRTEQTLQAIKTRTQKYQRDNEQLKQIVGDVKNIKAEQAEMEKKLGILQRLRDGRTGPVRVLDELSTIVPQRVWLTTMDQQSGTITFTGSGATLDEISNFMKKLKSSKFFNDPGLKNTRQSGENKVDFVITCGVKYTA